eukprot:EG_transcript_17025
MADTMDSIELKAHFHEFDLEGPAGRSSPPPEVSTCRVLLLLATLLGAATATSALIMLIPHPHPHSVFGHAAHGVMAPLTPGLVLPVSQHDMAPPARPPTALHATLPALKDSRADAATGGTEETWAFDFGGAGGPLQQKLACPAGSRLVAVCLPLPLGISFEQKAAAGGKPQVVVEGVVPGSNAAQVDVQPGDVLRACTAVFQVRNKPTEIEFFGNPPKLYSLPGVFVADNRPFAQAMSALKSNAGMIDGPAPPTAHSPPGRLHPRQQCKWHSTHKMFWCFRLAFPKSFTRKPHVHLLTVGEELLTFGCDGA